MLAIVLICVAASAAFVLLFLIEVVASDVAALRAAFAG